MADSSVKIRLALEGSQAVVAGLQGIGSAALRIGTIIAGAAGLGALGAAAVNTAKLGGELADLSARTGIATRSLIVLRQAFADAGVGADAVGSTVNKLQRTIIDAATAGGEASDALQGLGLSATALSTLAPEEQFAQVAAAISAIENPAQRTAAAMAIFGRSAGELLPLFADGGALQNAERVLGRMPEVLARNVPVLDNISDALDRLPNKATQLFAGILDQLGPSVQSILDAFESIDLTRAGQRIGAFVAVAIDEFKAGRFGEFVGLTIEAGFEAGFAAAGQILYRFTETTFANAVGNLSASLAAGILKAFVNIDSFFRGYWNGLVIWLGTTLYNALATAVNLFLQKMEEAITIAGASIRALMPSIAGALPQGNVSLGRVGTSPTDFDQALAAGMAVAKVRADSLGQSIDSLTEKYRELFGMQGQAPGQATGTASERLGALVNAQMARRDAQAAATATAPSGPQAPLAPAINTRLELQRLELDLAQRLQAIQAERGRVESSWLMTTNEKYAARKSLIEQERVAIEGQIEALRNLRALANEQDQMAIDRQIVGLQGRSTGLGNEAAGMGPDPYSFAQQFQATLIQLESQFLTVAQRMAQTFADVFNAATSSISNGIQGLIMGTVTWGQALLNIGQSIVQSLVRSFADMVAQWIMSHVIMRGVSLAWSAFQSSLRTKDVIEANATEAAKMPALAANATLASVSSFGVAAIIGVAAIAGILASLGAFQSGGYTGDGPAGEVAGIVHRGEYVVPADAVDRIGIGMLEAISTGNVTPAVATSSAAPSPITMNMAVFDDPRRMADWARSQDGRTVLVDIFRQHAHELAAT